MDQVAVGDYVLVPSAGGVLKYERVEMFYHREPETRAQFVVLITESKKRLAMTPLHLIPFGECEAMKRTLAGSDGVEKSLRGSRFADNAAVGDCVMTVDEKGQVAVEKIVKVGLPTYSQATSYITYLLTSLILQVLQYLFTN
ncbi:hypothetical protein ANCDUO_00362 [Ancylostoma duodenale]|uniref:Hedgehog protein Hint domain-containing protein n=1 Tax=Ancylostoma duodenale TaxID=51022 RepID=A0A0C2HCC1_9BILA|nr:hypothetical protein ANCDUO_00362 [Ancylostoma duodenale]